MSLRTWREHHGLTQAELARRLGLRSKGHVSRMETGAERVSADQAIAIDRLTAGEVPVRELRPDLHDVRVLRAGEPEPSGVVHL